MAWLNTAPTEDPHRSGKSPAPDANRPEPLTRLKQMQRDGLEPFLPDNPAPKLTGWLFEIGPTVPAGMGEAAIGWTDIVAWSTCTGVQLPPWQARLLRTLSGEWLAQKHKARKTDCPQPFGGTSEQIERNREAVAKQLAEAFRRLASGGKRKRQIKRA